MTTNETCRTMITKEKSLRFKQTTKCTTVVGTTFTRKAADILKFIAIVLWCCYYANAVDAQQLEQLEQEQQHLQQQQNYQQQKSYHQHQQQQQQQNHMQQHYEYQKQMQLQQKQQQYQIQNEEHRKLLVMQQEQASNQQAFHALLPITLPLKQQQQQQQQQPQQQRHKQHEVAVTPNLATNMQLLKTGTSLIVADGQKEYYDADEEELQSPALRRRAGNRKRKRRPQVTPTDVTYWRGNVEDDVTNHFNRNETRQSLSGKRRKNQSTNRETTAEVESSNKPRKTNLPITERDKSYRRPYAQSKKEATNDMIATVPTTSSKNELKNILKNSGGNMSLSEILQQKNLSLDDLLKGKQNALLALQTTAAGPSTIRQTEGNKPLNGVRRLPSLYGQSTTGQSEFNAKAIYPSSIINSSENIDANSSKNKLKFPTLQRLKLFGSSSRATTSTDISTTKRHETSTSTPATSLSTGSITTRTPLYKKRLQQRPTLKPPVLFKPIPSASSQTKENLSPLLLSSSSSSMFNSAEDTTPSENLEVDAAAAEEEEDFLINHSTTSTLKPSQKSTKTTRVTTTITSTTTTLATPSETEIPITSYSEITKDTEIFHILPTTTTSNTGTTTIANSVTSEQSIKIKSKYKNGEEFKVSRTNYISLNKGIQEDNLKSNSIESDDALNYEYNSNSNNVTYKPEEANSSYTDDDLENFFDDENPKENNSTKSIQHLTPRIDINIKEQQHQKNKQNNLINKEFSDGVDDRTDLLELIEDRRSGTRLFKILEQRNMTLEELIEHRKRGSSQLHLKTIVQNQPGLFSGQKVILQDNMDIVTAFENFPHFNLMNLKSVKPDDIKTDSQGSSYFTSIIDIEPTDDADKDDGGASEVISSESGDYSRRSEKSVGFFPSWKTLALASLNNPANKKNTATKPNPFFFPQPKIFLENVSQDLDAEDDKLLSLDNNDNNNNNINKNISKNDNKNDFRQKIKLPMLADDDTVEAIENEVARAHDILDLELSGHGFKRSPAAAASISNQYNNNVHTNMPAGIRSAIAASAAIVLTSLATFMVIFVVFRWKQRKRRKSSYMKTYNAMKSKMPALPINSRCSSARNMEEMMRGIATITQSPVHQLQRQSSLLFPRHSREESATPTERISGRTGSSLLGSCGLRKHDDGFDNDKRNKKVHHHHHHHHNNNHNGLGLGSTCGSMTSLALSLQSAQNCLSTKLNPMDTMDPNSPEVQEYLFDALRKSF